MKVSDVSLGSWLSLGGTVDARASRAVILEAWEHGINFFDTADVYSQGEAESVLGQALTELPRHEVVVATKVMGRTWRGPLGAGLSRKHVLDSVEASLRRLRLDYIDLYQAHAPDPETPLEEIYTLFKSWLAGLVARKPRPESGSGRGADTRASRGPRSRRQT